MTTRSKQNKQDKLKTSETPRPYEEELEDEWDDYYEDDDDFDSDENDDFDSDDHEDSDDFEDEEDEEDEEDDFDSDDDELDAYEDDEDHEDNDDFDDDELDSDEDEEDDDDFDSDDELDAYEDDEEDEDDELDAYEDEEEDNELEEEDDEHPTWLESFEGTRGVVLVFVFAFLLLSIFAGTRFTRQSAHPHYVFQADALLKGQWELGRAPYHPVKGNYLSNDWAQYYSLKLRNGKTLRGMYESRGGYPLYGRNLRQKYRFRTLKKTYYYFTHKDAKKRGGIYLPANQIVSKRRVYYVSFPPAPAFLMMPAMWLLEKLGQPRMRYNDMLFSLIFAALAIMLLFQLLQQLSREGRTDRSLYDNLILSMLFGFGTVFFSIAVQGTVWFTALVVGSCFSLLYLRFSLGAKHPFLAGLCLAGAFLCRPLLLMSGLFFMWEWARNKEGWDIRLDGDRLRRLFLFGAPLTAIVGAMMYANYVRFGSITEFGHTYLPAVYYKATQYGLFHPRWFARNFFAGFLALPKIGATKGYTMLHFSHILLLGAALLGYWKLQQRTRSFEYKALLVGALGLVLYFGYGWIFIAFAKSGGWFKLGIQFNAHGTSLFFTTPCFLLLFLALVLRDRAIAKIALGIAILLAIPPLFYQNTGWITFGNRFSLDYTPYLIVLLACSRVSLRKPLFQVLFWFAIAVNAFGAITFGREWKYYELGYKSLDWISKLVSW